MRVVLAGLVAAAACVSPPLQYVQPGPGTDASAGLGQLGTKQASALRTAYAQQLARAAAPIELATTDAGAIPLRILEANVAIEGPLARTELRMTFANPAGVQREVRLAVALPREASVARFAVKRGAAWDEAAVVERPARVVPASLVPDRGDAFTAHGLVIGAMAEVELVLAYDHTVGATYTLPLAGLPAGAAVSATLTHDGVTERVERPDHGDVVVELARGPTAVASSDAFVAGVPWSAALADDPLEDVAILVDTSASRTSVMGRQAEVVRRLAAAMPPNATVTVAAFDHAPVELYRGAAGRAGGVTDALFDHGALGASHLGAALAWAAASGMTRVVIVGDGAATLGDEDPTALAAILAGGKVARVDAVQLGATRADALEALVRAGARPGAIVDGRDPVRAARQLAAVVPPEERISVDGAVATWPATTRGMVPGEPVWVYGLHAKAAAALTVRIGARAFPIASKAAGDARRVRRAVAGAELGDLTVRLAGARPADRPALAERLARLAIEHGRISARTAMLAGTVRADEDRYAGEPGTPGRTFDLSGATDGRLQSSYIVEQSIALSQPLAGNALDHAAIVRATQSSAFALGAPEVLPEPRRFAAPYTGTFHRVMQAISEKERGVALEIASAWQLANPTELAALIALGEALEARGATMLAARAYGSIIDLYPHRPELVRAGGERMDRLPGARALAIDAYRRSLRARPEEPTTYRLLAFALVREGRSHEALDALDEGMRHAKQQNVLQLLAEDAALIAAHVVARDPSARRALEGRVRGPLSALPSMRVVLSWDTDAFNVDLHVHDRRGNHASPERPEMSSGGRVREDRTGKGLELFAVDQPYAFPYQIGAHFTRGNAGLGLGTVQVIRHDGRGNLTIEDRPFVVQNDDALVDLGVIKGT